MKSRRLSLSILLVSLLAAGPAAQSGARGGRDSIQEPAVKEWLTYLASDELQGRATYTEGLGLAAAYIAQHLEEWGVKPAGDNGTYFQTVKVLGVRTNSRSSVTVAVNGESRTFKDGEGITLPRNMGSNQTIVADQLQFAGYGLSVPAAGHDDYASFDPKGKVVIWLGSQAPQALGDQVGRLMRARARTAVLQPPVADAVRDEGPWTTATSPPCSDSIERCRRRSRPRTNSSSSCSAAPM